MRRHSLWKVVKELNAESRLAIFVGAGISMSCGLPSWHVLVERVVNRVWRHNPSLAKSVLERHNLHAIRYARLQAGDHFNGFLSECLYKDEIHISRSLWAIARCGARLICSFNFDDLLEEALRTDGTQAAIITPGERFNREASTVTVYHPHGILPRFCKGAEVSSLRIVFSEDDYHDLYSDPYSLANVFQLSLLTGYSILCVGLSMQDPNLRRLIDVTRSRGFRNQHFAVFRDPTKQCPSGDVSQQQGIRRMIEMDMRSLGITPWFVDDYDKVGSILEAIAAKRRGNRV